MAARLTEILHSRDGEKENVKPASSNISTPSPDIVCDNSSNQTPAPTPALAPAPAPAPPVPCAVCRVPIPSRRLEEHETECRASSCDPRPQPTASPQTARQPLPKLVLEILKEPELRKKCKEFGLNNKGDKAGLAGRIKRYRRLYNAECDRENPRSVKAILCQVRIVPFYKNQSLMSSSDFSVCRWRERRLRRRPRRGRVSHRRCCSSVGTPQARRGS